MTDFSIYERNPNLKRIKEAPSIHEVMWRSQNEHMKLDWRIKDLQEELDEVEKLLKEKLSGSDYYEIKYSKSGEEYFKYVRTLEEAGKVEGPAVVSKVDPCKLTLFALTDEGTGYSVRQLKD
jgi:hypothetical protein